jgi:hypothetical protein
VPLGRFAPSLVILVPAPPVRAFRIRHDYLACNRGAAAADVTS